jgi:hypothetical protein
MEVIKLYAKPAAVYIFATASGWVASRYHLTGDQISAITTDLGGLAAIVYGVWSHGQASKGAPNA